MSSASGEKSATVRHAVDRIDPESVPEWPRPVVTVGSGGIDIDGEAVELPPDLEPTSSAARQIALRAAVSNYAELQRPIAVRARDADGAVWDLVVAPDGTVMPMDDVPATRSRPARRRRRSAGPDRRRGLVAMVGFLVVVTLLGSAVFVMTRPDAPLRARFAPAPTPPPANLPVTPPPGFGARAVWATPIGQGVEKSDVVLLPGHRVAFVGGEGKLEVRDATTGVLRWDAEPSLFAGTEAELLLTDIGGEPALVLGDSSELQYWRLDDPRHRSRRLVVPGGGGSGVSFLGGSPLVSLADQTAGHVVGDEFELVDVPIGARAVSSDGREVLAVDEAGRMWRLRSEQGVPPEPERLRPPAKKASLLAAAGLANGTFVAAWRYGVERVAVLYESPGGEELARQSLSSVDPYEQAVPGGIDDDDLPIVSSDDGRVVAVEDAVFFTREREQTQVTGLTVKSATGGHLYGADATGSWLDVTTTGRERVAGEASAPLAVDDTGAFLVTTKLGKDLLYRLPTVREPPPTRGAKRGEGS